MRRFLLFMVCLGALGGAAATTAAAVLTPESLGSPSAASAGSPLLGSVVDGLTARPVAGATVAASTGPSTLTTANGGFSLAVPNGSVTLAVSAPGYHSATLTIVYHAGAPPVNVTLQPFVFALHGAVVDRGDSVGLAGFVVVANPGDVVTTSSTTGTYRLNLENGTYSVTVSGPGYQSSTTSVVVDGAPVTLYLFLSPPPAAVATAPATPWPILLAGIGAGATTGALGAWSARGRRAPPARTPSGPLAGLPSFANTMVRARMARGRRNRMPPR
ncbi:MAG: carboxypeptidase regulatory-like domain-containing protein [Thermoplasmata archaeon]|nr:carboxypeptidase regulatory-like domain-containing protein [Thermoplasmata archaeon]